MLADQSNGDELGHRIQISMERLEPALLEHPLEKAAEALALYVGGASIDAVYRATGVPRCRVEKWVKIVGVARSRSEVKALQRHALDKVRHLTRSAL